MTPVWINFGLLLRIHRCHSDYRGRCGDHLDVGFISMCYTCKFDYFTVCSKLTDVDIGLKDACVGIAERSYLVELRVNVGDARPIIITLQQIKGKSFVHF